MTFKPNVPAKPGFARRFMRNFARANGVILVGGVAFTAYQYPELRKNPSQLVWAAVRGIRCATTATMMGCDYYFAKEINSELHYKASKRMYDTFCANGGPYIKLGQMFGQLQQLVPAEYIETFEPMCMQAPRTKFEDVKQIVESELNMKLDDVFSEFAEQPIASASLGQVHKARLRSTGEQVAVKVQHQWIKAQVPGDLNIIDFATDVARFVFPNFKYGWLPEQFRSKLPLELDYFIEADNCKRCGEIFKDNPRVKVPKVYDEYTRNRVLVMSFEKGTPVTYVKQLHEQGIDLKLVASQISQAFVKMIFEEGFIHADPHPGNLFVRPNPNNPKDIELVLLDHGIYTSMDRDVRLSYNKLWRGIISQNETQIKEASQELGTDFYELFASMVSNRKYEDVMDENKKSQLKARLGDINTDEAKAEQQEIAMYYHEDIVEILDIIKRELLLVFKTNNYLRAIDQRLGNPINTFQIMNEVTWKVYKNEVRHLDEEVGSWQFFKENCQFYWLKFILGMMYLRIRFLSALGYKLSDDELENFDLDVVETTPLTQKIDYQL